MANGTTKPIAEVQVGEAIYGTVRDGYYRHYAITEVLAHWSTVKPAYRVTLEDGTTLVASGDHRFLTQRGWKHVTGAEQGPDQRPFLTVNNKLMGVGAFAEPPKESTAYRRGYLCGMIRGDANLRTYGGPQGDIFSFRLALADTEALTRARHYLGTFGILTSEFDFSAASETRRAIRAIRTGARGNVLAIQHLIDWPTAPCEDWFHGFLAGIFDAEGSCSGGIWRVANTDQEILDWTARALSSFGFDYALESRGWPNGLQYIRLRGGLREVMRFFHTTDPAITRKRSIEGVGAEEQREAAGGRDRAAGYRVADVRHHDRDRRLHRERSSEP